MEAVQTSGTPVNSYQSTRHYNPEDSHHQLRHLSSQGSAIFLCVRSYMFFLQGPDFADVAPYSVRRQVARFNATKGLPPPPLTALYEVMSKRCWFYYVASSVLPSVARESSSLCEVISFFSALEAWNPGPAVATAASRNRNTCHA
jgi:hypothetical protein